MRILGWGYPGHVGQQLLRFSLRQSRDALVAATKELALALFHEMLADAGGIFDVRWTQVRAPVGLMASVISRAETPLAAWPVYMRTLQGLVRHFVLL